MKAMADMNSDPSVKRFWAKVDKGGHGGCWLFTGCKNERGYGGAWLFGKMTKAHRASWMLNRGPIPPGIEVCHKCDVRNCVNPEHLFLGTHRDNLRDAEQKGRLYRPHKNRTHCKAGHPLDASNTRMRMSKGRPYRYCIICYRERSKLNKRKHRAEYNAKRRAKRAADRALRHPSPAPS